MGGSPKNENNFAIMRAEAPGGVPGVFTELGTAMANATSYVDTTTSAGTEYAYKVVARNAAPESESAVVFVPPIAP